MHLNLVYFLISHRQVLRSQDHAASQNGSARAVAGRLPSNVTHLLSHDDH